MLDDELNSPSMDPDEMAAVYADKHAIQITSRVESMRNELDEVGDVRERLQRWAQLLGINFQAIIELLRLTIAEMARESQRDRARDLAPTDEYDFCELANCVDGDREKLDQLLSKASNWESQPANSESIGGRSQIRAAMLHSANWVETLIAHLVHLYAYDFDALHSELKDRCAGIDGVNLELLFDRIVHDACDANVSLMQFLAKYACQRD